MDETWGSQAAQKATTTLREGRTGLKFSLVIDGIQAMNIQTFRDLNLPYASLDALLPLNATSRARRTPGASQPAVSNALNRLRELLDDPLLVRAGRAMHGRPQALALEAPIRAALRQIEQSLERRRGLRSRAQPAALHRSGDRLRRTDLHARPDAPPGERAPGISIAINMTPTLPAEALDKANWTWCFMTASKTSRRASSTTPLSQRDPATGRPTSAPAAGAGSRPGHLSGATAPVGARRADQGDGRPVAGQPGAQAASGLHHTELPAGGAHRRVQRPDWHPHRDNWRTTSNDCCLQSFDLLPSTSARSTWNWCS